MEEDTLLVCMPIEDMQGDPVQGSVQMGCDECGVSIWVAPSSRMLLDKEDPFLLVCTRCALKEAREAAAVTGHERKSRELERLRKLAEEAYGRMYDVSSDRAAKWEYEIAYDSLRAAARLARELDRLDEALELDKRAEHIRQVFRHQFMMPPGLIN